MLQKSPLSFNKPDYGMTFLIKSIELHSFNSVHVTFCEINVQMMVRGLHLKPNETCALECLQMNLVGTGYSGPPLDLNKAELTAEERQKNCWGLDERQLRMLKAQVRAKRADFLEVIDRAVAIREEQIRYHQANLAASGKTVHRANSSSAASTLGAGQKLGQIDGGSANALIKGGLEPTTWASELVFITQKEPEEWK